MENWTEHLEKYLEEGKLLPLIGEKFSRKIEIGDKLRLQREESRKIALSRRRKKSGARGNVFLYWGIAAMFIVLLGIGGYYVSENKIVAGATASVDYELPDGSNVQIMPNSHLTYNKLTWLWERKLQLDGKASFSVTPGKTFTVHTEAGDVTVVGTKFLIDQQGKKMLVDCEEGSVNVETAVGKRTLVAGESVRCDENKIVTVPRKEELEFPEVLGYEDDPLINVVADIEKIFRVKVVGHEKCEGLTYHGTVLTRDLNTTLEKVFGSCGISYQLHGNEIILQ